MSTTGLMVTNNVKSDKILTNGIICDIVISNTDKICQESMERYIKSELIIALKQIAGIKRKLEELTNKL